MTCRPQLRGTGIFRPRVTLQNNKQKVRLSNSGSGGANPKERPVEAKGLEKLEMWPWCRHPQCPLLPEGAWLKWVSVTTAGVETMEEEAGSMQTGQSLGGGQWQRLRWEHEGKKQKVRREPEPQPGRGVDERVGEENRTSGAFKAKRNHAPSPHHLKIKQWN